MLAPLRVSVPPETVRPPPLMIAPEKVSAAAVRVRVEPPSVTPPEPDRLLIEMSPLANPMLNVPSSLTPEDVAIEPAPETNRTAPASMVVAPV